MPDIGQKVARKVCLRKIRKPYDLVLKAVPNINSLVFHWSSFPCLPLNLAQLACLARPQLKNSICIHRLVQQYSANRKYLIPNMVSFQVPDNLHCCEMVSPLENTATSVQNNVFIMIEKSFPPFYVQLENDRLGTEHCELCTVGINTH